MTDFTPEDAVEAVEMLFEFIPPEISNEMPDGMTNIMAAIVLIFDNAANSNCVCDTCTRLREIKNMMMPGHV